MVASAEASASAICLRDKMRAHADAVQRIAQIVAEDRQKQLAGPIDTLDVTADGLGERLIERLVKAGDVVDVVEVGLRSALAPEAQDAGTQGAGFGDDLDDVESRAGALLSVP